MLKGKYVDHVKMYLNDGGSSLGSGVLFTDHCHLGDTVERVQAVANALEEFLKDNKIIFKRK